MSVSMKVFTAAAGALALAALVGYAQAQPGPAGPGARASRWLNLTEAQRDEIAKLRDEHRAAMRDQATALRDARRALHTEIFADNPDEAKIESLKEQLAQLDQQLHLRRIDLQTRMSRVFTPEQRRLIRERGLFMRGWRAGAASRDFRMRGRRGPWYDE